MFLYWAMLKVAVFSDGSFKTIEKEIQANYKLVFITDRPDCVLILYRQSQHVFELLEMYKNIINCKFFIKEVISKSDIEMVRRYHNVYFLSFRIYDLDIYNFKFIIDYNIRHIDIKLICRSINISEELIHELSLINTFIGDQVFNSSSLRVSINTNTLHASRSCTISLFTCSLYISNLQEPLKENDDMTYVITIYDSSGESYSLSSPLDNSTYFERFGYALCAILKNAKPSWIPKQQNYMKNISLKLEPIRRLINL